MFTLQHEDNKNKVDFIRESVNSNLNQFVDYFFFLEKKVVKKSDYIIFPSGTVKVLLHFGDIPVVKNLEEEKYKKIPKHYIYGVNDKPHVSKLRGTLKVFGIKFHPWGFAQFVDSPSQEFSEKRSSISNIFTDIELKSIYSVNDFKEISKTVSDILEKKLKDNDKPYDMLLKKVCQKVIYYKGNINVEMAISEIPVSKRHIERIFKQRVGITLVKFIKIVRFHHFMNLKLSNPSISLTELAYQCGYSDQAHFNRDFKSFTGFTPFKYFNDSYLTKITQNYFAMRVI